MAELSRKQDPYIYMLSKRGPPESERYTQTKSKWMEKDILCKQK